MTIWQPIETAPKDETAILLYSSAHEFGVVVGFWSEEYGDWFDSEAASYPLNPSPTHWMPLPEPPKEQGSGNDT